MNEMGVQSGDRSKDIRFNKVVGAIEWLALIESQEKKKQSKRIKVEGINVVGDVIDPSLSHGCLDLRPESKSQDGILLILISIAIECLETISTTIERDERKKCQFICIELNEIMVFNRKKKLI